MGLWSRWKNTVEAWARHHKQVPKPWALMKQACKDYQSNWMPFVAIILIVSVPVSLLSAFVVAPGADTTMAAYIAFAQLAMNVAVIYGVREQVSGRKVEIRQAYYKGSAMLVRLILISVLLTLMLLFAVLGGFIIATGVFSTGGTYAGPEVFLLVLLGILLAIPSVILVTRALWSVYVIFETDKGPLQAIGFSRKITKGRVVVTLGRLLALLGALLLLMVIPTIGLLFLESITGLVIWGILLQILTSLVVLPLSNFYLYRLYQGLK